MLSEIRVQPDGAEFIEIYNGTGSTIDLTDYYLTDATYATGGTYYYNIVTGADYGGGAFYDFHARFPAGASIAHGEYQTIALNGSTAFTAQHGVAPTYELYEDDGSPDGIPDMLEAVAGSINGQGTLTNGGEVIILYHWDGASDLVQDVDYALWGDKAEAVDKTAVSVDGPDGDSTPSTYEDDTAIGAQDVISDSAPAFDKAWSRIDFSEGTETQSNGNGIEGDDETSENVSTTWAERDPTPGAPAAGS